MKPLLLPKKLLVLFSGFGFAILLGWLLNLSYQHSYNLLLLWIGVAALLLSEIIIIIDIIKNQSQRQFFWIMSVLLFNGIACIIYLIRRKEDIKI